MFCLFIYLFWYVSVVVWSAALRAMRIIPNVWMYKSISVRVWIDNILLNTKFLTNTFTLTYKWSLQIRPHYWRSQWKNMWPHNPNSLVLYIPVWRNKKKTWYSIRTIEMIKWIRLKCFFGRMPLLTCKKSPATILKPPLGFTFTGLTSGNVTAITWSLREQLLTNWCTHGYKVYWFSTIHLFNTKFDATNMNNENSLPSQ